MASTPRRYATRKKRHAESAICTRVIDRDLNAAINLKNTVSFTEINACGDRVSPRASNGGIEAVVDEAGILSQTSMFEMFV